MKSIFSQLGGLSAVNELANEFFNVMERDFSVKELRDLHPGNLYMSRKKLYKFLTQWFGGPALFGEQYVNAKWLELKHRRMKLDDSKAAQWLYCMDTAMTNLGINHDLKQEMHIQFSEMIKAMRDQRNCNNEVK